MARRKCAARALYRLALRSNVERESLGIVKERMVVDESKDQSKMSVGRRTPSTRLPRITGAGRCGVQSGVSSTTTVNNELQQLLLTHCTPFANVVHCTLCSTQVFAQSTAFTPSHRCRFARPYGTRSPRSEPICSTQTQLWCTKHVPRRRKCYPSAARQGAAGHRGLCSQLRDRLSARVRDRTPLPHRHYRMWSRGPAFRCMCTPDGPGCGGNCGSQR